MTLTKPTAAFVLFLLLAPVARSESADLGSAQPDTLAGALHSLVADTADGGWDGIAGGLDPASSPPEDPAALTRFQSARRVMETCNETFERWTVDRAADLRAAASAQDAEAWRHATSLIAFDGIRAQIADNLRDGLRPGVKVDARHEVMRTLFELFLAPLIPEEPVDEKLAHVAPNIAYFMSRLESREVVGDPERAEYRAHPDEYGDVALGLLDELGSVIQHGKTRDEGGSAGAHAVARTFDSTLRLHEADELIDLARQLGEGISKGEWQQMEDGWKLAVAPATQWPSELTDSARAAVDLRRTCDRMFELGCPDQRSLFWVAISEGRHRRVATALAVQGYEQMRLFLSQNVRLELETRSECQARLEASQRVFKRVVEPWLLTIPLAQQSGHADGIRGGFNGLTLPQVRSKQATAEHGRRVVRLLQQLVNEVRGSVTRDFGGTAAVPGAPQAPARYIDSLIRESRRLLISTDPHSARRTLKRALAIDARHAEARRLVAVTNRQIARALGDVGRGAEQFLVETEPFLSLIERVRSDMEVGRWAALRAGLTSGGSTQRGMASAGRDLRDTAAALMSITGRNRRDLLEAAIVGKNAQAMEQALLVLCFDACRAQVTLNLADELTDAQACSRRNQFLSVVANQLVADGGELADDERAQSISTALQAMTDPSLLITDATADAAAQVQQRGANVRQYTGRSLVLIDELLAVVAPFFRVASEPQFSDGPIPEGPDFLTTVHEVRAAVAGGRWSALEAGYTVGAGLGDGPGPAGTRLAAIHRLLSTAFSRAEKERSNRIRSSLERRDEKQLELALVLLGFDQMRLDVLRNRRCELRPHATVVERNRRITDVYRELIAPLLEGSDTLSAGIAAKLAGLNDPGLIGTPADAALRREPSVDDYSRAALAVLGEIADALGASESMNARLPAPFEVGDPDEFVNMIGAVRQGGLAGHWPALRHGLAGGSLPISVYEQQASFAAAEILRKRTGDVDREYEITLGDECRSAARAESTLQLERALLALTYDTIRLKYARNLGDGLMSADVTASRGHAIRALYDQVLSTRVVDLPGAGRDSGEIRDEQIRAQFSRIADLERYGTPQERPGVQVYLREVLAVLKALSSAVVLIDPMVEPTARVGQEPDSDPLPAPPHPQAPFRADDPGAFLELVRLLRNPLDADGWEHLAAGFGQSEPLTASDPDEPEAVDLGRRLRERCNRIDSARGSARAAVVGRVLESQDPESLERVLLIVAVDTLKVKVRANRDDRLIPRRVSQARNRAISEIYGELLRPVVRAHPAAGETGAAGDERILGLFARMSSVELLSLSAEEVVPGYYELALTAMKAITAAFNRMPQLTGTATAPRRPSQPFEASDPEAYLTTVRRAREAAETGRWGELLHGFQEADLDTDVARAGRDLRRRAEEVSARLPKDSVGDVLQQLQETSKTSLETAIITLTFDLLRLKILRNIRDYLRPYNVAAKRSGAILAIYGEVLQPYVVDSNTGGEARAVELRTAIELLASPELLGTDPATDIEPTLQPDPETWGDAATELLVQLSTAISGSAISAGVVPEDDPEWARLAKRYDSYSEDFYLKWGVDGFRTAMALGREGEVLKGLREGGSLLRGERMAVSAGRAIHSTCALINKLVGNDLLPEWDKAMAARDREILNRLLVLTAFEVMRLKLNDNIRTELKDYVAVVRRNKDARLLYDSVCRAAVYSEDSEGVLIGKLHDQLIRRRFSEIDSSDLIGRKPKQPDDRRRVDVDAYRQASVKLLEFVLTAISNPEKAIEGFEMRGPRPFDLPIDRGLPSGPEDDDE